MTIKKIHEHFQYSDKYPDDVAVKSSCQANKRTNELKEAKRLPPTNGLPLHSALHKRMIIQLLQRNDLAQRQSRSNRS